jgi:hypothetical protein
MEMGPAKRGQSEDIQQCEFCACWTRDGSFVGEQRHFICRWCKREARKNWFIRRIVERWEGMQTYLI